MTYLPELFESVVKSKPFSDSVIEDTRRWTFQELSNEVDRIAGALKQRVKGDTVGILLNY